MSEVLPLTDSQRIELINKLDEDGYVVLPQKLPQEIIQNTIKAIDRVTDSIRGDKKSQSVKVAHCIEKDEAFFNLMLYEPALQLTYDKFGPTFHLCQSNFISRPKENVIIEKADFVSASPWHADGPRPYLFPSVNGAMGLHYLKFGYFLTDLTHPNGGPLQVVRGSHKRPELDGSGHFDFKIENYEKDLVTFNVEAGTVIAFHQAQWHAAPPNLSEIERKNVYISYCPIWMKPIDHDYPSEEVLKGYGSEVRWILSEPRPAIRWWLPSEHDLTRLDRLKRDVDKNKVVKASNYE